VDYFEQFHGKFAVI